MSSAHQQEVPHKPVVDTLTSTPAMNRWLQIWEYVKLFYGTCIVILLVAVAFTGIGNQWCVLKIHPAGLFIILFFCIVLLAYVEALHYACVSVEKWDMAQYETIFPRAYKCYKLVDTPEKVKKFLLGRQFFVIFVVFLIAQITSFPDIPKNFVGMPAIMVIILVRTGLPGVAITLTFGQLISQIYVEQYTLEFLNCYGCEFVIRLSLFTEWTGVCNFSWLLYHLGSRFCCQTICAKAGTHEQMVTTDGIEDATVPTSPTTKNRPDHEPLSFNEGGGSLTVFDMFKFAWSTFATCSAIFIVLYGISKDVYVLPTPPGATYIIFFGVLTLLFYLEGMMIAIVATQYWDPETFRDVYPRAYKLHKLINKPDNVKRFIIGRQFCTVLTGFLLAQITTFAEWSGEGYDPIGFYIIIKSGLVGVLIVLSFGQLMPELLAQEYPLRFMDMPGSYSIGYISLFFDGVGVGHAAWTIYYATRNLCCVLSDRKTLSAVKMNSGDSVKNNMVVAGQESSA